MVAKIRKAGAVTGLHVPPDLHYMETPIKATGWAQLAGRAESVEVSSCSSLQDTVAPLPPTVPNQQSLLVDQPGTI